MMFGRMTALLMEHGKVWYEMIAAIVLTSGSLGSGIVHHTPAPHSWHDSLDDVSQNWLRATPDTMT
jgi:hypothetical protein